MSAIKEQIEQLTKEGYAITFRQTGDDVESPVMMYEVSISGKKGIVSVGIGDMDAALKQAYMETPERDGCGGAGSKTLFDARF